jgi:hypothetical protein
MVTFPARPTPKSFSLRYNEWQTLVQALTVWPTNQVPCFTFFETTLNYPPKPVGETDAAKLKRQFEVKATVQGVRSIKVEFDGYLPLRASGSIAPVGNNTWGTLMDQNLNAKASNLLKWLNPVSLLK